ncbi:MAG: hypothetical protein H0W40_11380 [Methylibium sp.]|uniref:hypothetical protein n=1 Tax=Methylibium sp. TaxID=2067992 RepID=UPI0018009864|nr:hypothetical protein [Methylibium sp.]MBA3597959.1 hypothetical protein [Methylibium sp.]
MSEKAQDLDTVDAIALAATVCERVIAKQIGAGSEQRAAELRCALAKVIARHAQQCAVDWLAEASWMADKLTEQQAAAEKAAQPARH